MANPIKKLILLFIVFFSFSVCLHSQPGDNKSALIFSHPDDGILYVTTDKTLYTPGEVIWFAGYLLPTGQKPDSLNPDILSVALLKTDTTDYSIQKNYFINEGLCSGSMSLPQNLSPGIYHLIAATNILKASGLPAHVFRTTISIKSVNKPPFITEFTIDSTRKSDTTFLTAQAVLANGKYVNGKGNTIKYHLFNQKPKIEKLGLTGNAILAIPKSDLKKSDNILYTATTCDNSTQYFNLQIPLTNVDSLIVKFYPQQISLVAGIQNKIWWRTFSANNKPVSVKASLLEDSRVIDTIQTDEDGIGSFDFIPVNHKQYSLRVVEPGYNQQYSLPKIEPRGVVLDVTDLAPSTDTLLAIVRTNYDNAFKISMSNSNDTSTWVSDVLHINQAKRLKLSLTDLPKGLHTLGLLNEKDSLLSRQMFFAHFDKNNIARITTNKAEYRAREKVEVKTSFTDEKGESPQGIFTAYCVLLNRIEPEKKQKITNYYYYDYWLQDGYMQTNYLDRVNLNNRLQLSGNNLLNRQLIPTTPSKLIIQGNTFRKDNRKIKDSINLLISTGSNTILIKTDKNGTFTPSVSDLVVSEGRPLWIKPINGATGSNKTKNYVFEIKNPMLIPMQQLKKIPYQNIIPGFAQTTRELIMKDSFAWATLETVVVKAKQNELTRDVFYTNSCGDYVCGAGILNCPNHLPGSAGNKKPVKGQSYRMDPTKFGPQVTYQGCIDDDVMDNIEPIFTGRKFEGMDSARLADTGTLSELATIYWQPFIVINKQTVFDFYTSDLTGKYKIVIEGVAVNGQPFYAEKIITIAGAQP